MQPVIVKARDQDFAIVGEGYMMLRGQYDGRQLWFPFMDKAVFRVIQPPPEPEPYTKARLPKNAYASGPDALRGPPEMKAPQPCLMFPEFKRVTRKQFKTISKLKFPMWDKDDAGQPFTVDLNATWRKPDEDMRRKLIDWCDDQLTRRYFLSPSQIACESKNDSVLVKLKFG